MRVFALVLTAILIGAPARAQQAAPLGPSPAETATSSGQDAAPLKLPVSVEKIRIALEQPVQPLKGLDETPHFRVEIQEWQRFHDLISSLKFDSGPAPPGGLYAYETQQVMMPKSQHPEMQPYGAFSQSELLQVALTTFLERYYGGRVLSALTNAERTLAERAARGEVAREIAVYCAAQPNHAAGIEICNRPDLR